MQRAGFLDTDAGPFATELRESMSRKQAAGLVSASPGTWADGPLWKIDAEVRAKALLSLDWELEHGHSHRVDCFDPPVRWQYNVRTGTRRLVVKWSRLGAWFGDRWREAGMHYRVWRDRKLVNPYRG